MNYSSILITGGTGSFGRALVQHLVRHCPEVTRIAIYSRDEMKQFEMQQEYPAEKYPQMRFFIGDVRDQDRVRRALENVEVVIHAAALKQVPAAEYNPFEAIKTNVLGAQNVIDAAIACGIKRVVALSTDKAAAPINLYGATKLCSDKLFCAANGIRGRHQIQFAIVRYGNVMGSRGSVIPLFLKLRQRGVLPITDPRMTRFNITLEEGVRLVLYALENMWGGEIFVPKIPSYRILDVAEAVAPSCRRQIVGVRPGEKLHEEMITATDGLNSLEFDRYFTILPSTNFWDVKSYREKFGGRGCSAGFKYSSDENQEWLTVENLRQLIQQFVDPSFQPL